METFSVVTSDSLLYVSAESKETAAKAFLGASWYGDLNKWKKTLTAEEEVTQAWLESIAYTTPVVQVNHVYCDKCSYNLKEYKAAEELVAYVFPFKVHVRVEDCHVGDFLFSTKDVDGSILASAMVLDSMTPELEELYRQGILTVHDLRPSLMEFKRLSTLPVWKRII